MKTLKELYLDKMAREAVRRAHVREQDARTKATGDMLDFALLVADAMRDLLLRSAIKSESEAE